MPHGDQPNVQNRFWISSRVVRQPRQESYAGGVVRRFWLGCVGSKSSIERSPWRRRASDIRRPVAMPSTAQRNKRNRTAGICWAAWRIYQKDFECQDFAGDGQVTWCGTGLGILGFSSTQNLSQSRDLAAGYYHAPSPYWIGSCVNLYIRIAARHGKKEPNKLSISTQSVELL